MSGKKENTKRAQRVKNFPDLPCLTDILDHFTDARAMVSVAFSTIFPKVDSAGDACHVLYLGVPALNRVANELEEAEAQFDECRKQYVKRSAP